jgi:hypothetical protein
MEGPCRSHPNRPGAWVLSNGSMLCDPCHYMQRGRGELAVQLHQKYTTLAAQCQGESEDAAVLAHYETVIFPMLEEHGL